MKLKFDFEGFRKDIRTKRLIEDEQPIGKTLSEIGISRATLWRCETGNVPDLMTYAKLCKWLDISMDKHFKKQK